MVASNAQWSPRYRHEIVVFHDIIWLIGGVNGKYEKKFGSQRMDSIGMILM
jgi:hypothetical protein